MGNKSREDRQHLYAAAVSHQSLQPIVNIKASAHAIC